MRARLTLALLLAASVGMAAIANIQPSSGGTFQATTDYVVSGSWLWTNDTPWCFPGRADIRWRQCWFMTDPTASGTLTFPARTDTVVTRSAAETLTSKTLTNVTGLSFLGSQTITGTGAINISATGAAAISGATVTIGGTDSVSIGSSTDGTVNITELGAATFEATSGGARLVRGHNTELITLSTSGTETLSAATMFPANSWAEGVTCRITTTATTASSLAVTDEGHNGDADWFTFSTMTSGQTKAAFIFDIVNMADYPPVYATARKLVINADITAGAGAMRCTVFYRQLVAPTS
jgi:hypothetical protein